MFPGSETSPPGRCLGGVGFSLFICVILSVSAYLQDEGSEARSQIMRLSHARTRVRH